jgi:hypothetical protein
MKVYIPAELQQQVRERFANCRAYCRTAEALTVGIFEFEHIVPRSADGATVFDNLCLSCPTCNRFKSNRVSAPDPVLLDEVALFHPHQQRWFDHFSWNEDANQIIGLTPTGRATIAALRRNRPQIIRVRQMWVAMNEHPPGVD